MTKHGLIVCAILFSVACPASLNAAVTEEYKSIEVIEAEQAPEATAPTESRSSSVALVTTQSSSAGDVVLETRASAAPAASTMALTPLFGTTQFQGPWGVNIRNQYTFGLALELPVSRYFAFEIEGNYGNYRLAYTPNPSSVVAYSFDQYSIGGNGKIYLSQSRLRPYIGAGLSAQYYANMSRALPTGQRAPYEHILGSAALMVGADIRLTDSISIGARAQYLMPVINRPFTANAVGATGLQAASGFEETGFLNANLMRLLGSVTIQL
jgi:outer membrane protein W